jgi:RNA polymerase sigma factor (sigma-70 family)
MDPSVALDPDRLTAAAALLADCEPAFRRTARRLSLCADDADDAFQRAVEILLTKAPPIAHRRLVAWMHVVTRREALALRRLRERLLGAGAMDEGAVDQLPSAQAEPADHLERRERVGRAAQLLALLKPQERRAIVLQAGGYSYAEICAITGWTYTKVNRCLAEGRARLYRLADASGLRS